MKSDTLPPEFSLLIDGRLSQDEARSTQSRIEANPDLSSQFEQFREARDHMRANALAALPAGFDARLRERLRMAELQHQAELRVRAAEGRDPWWQRIAIAIGGIAAGASFVMVVNGGKTPQLGASDESRLSVAPGEAMQLTGAEIEPIVTRQLRAFGELRRQAAAVEQVDPQWLKAELACTGLEQSSQRLTALVRNVRDIERVKYETAVVSLGSACDALGRLADEAIEQEQELENAQVLVTMDSVPAVHKAVSDSAERNDTATVRQYSLVYAPQTGNAPSELNAYMQARMAYQNGAFEPATQKFVSFINSYPSSRYFTSAAYFATKSLERDGDAESAAVLLDAISRKRPEVLVVFSENEVQRLAEQSTPRAVANVGWVASADGMMRLNFQTDLRSTVKGAAACDSANAASTLLERWKLSNDEQARYQEMSVPNRTVPVEGKAVRDVAPAPGSRRNR